VTWPDEVEFLSDNDKTFLDRSFHPGLSYGEERFEAVELIIQREIVKAFNNYADEIENAPPAFFLNVWPQIKTSIIADIRDWATEYKKEEEHG